MKRKTLTGLSSFAEDSNCKPISKKDFEKMVNYLGSKKYRDSELKKEKRRYEGQKIANEALLEGRITEMEYLVCLNSIAFNGFLLVSPELGNKILRLSGR
jgi:hypothetical protein